MRFINRELMRENAEKRRRRLEAARALGTHTIEEWQALCVEFDYRCVRCGASCEKIHKDHVLPLYQGGSDSVDNLQPLCRRCNCAKGPETTNWAVYRRTHGFGDVAT